jgi:hypothetical protein
MEILPCTLCEGSNFRQENPGIDPQLILPHTEQARVAVYVLVERG